MKNVELLRYVRLIAGTFTALLIGALVVLVLTYRPFSSGPLFEGPIWNAVGLVVGAVVVLAVGTGAVVRRVVGRQFRFY